MAAEPLPDFEALVTELRALERQERELSKTRRKLHDMIDLGFPNEVVLPRERQISDERRALHRRIDELRTLLGPTFGRTP